MKKEEMPTKIEISHRTVIFTVIFLLGIYLLYHIRDILLQVFVALLIMAVLNPFVTRLEKFKIPRALSIIVTYVIAISLVSVSIAGIVPPLIEQSARFVEFAPQYMDHLNSSVLGEQFLKEVLGLAGTIPSQLAKTGLSLLSNILNVFTVLIFSFYLLLSRDKLSQNYESFLGQALTAKVDRILRIIEKKLGGWAIGQFSLMLLVGFTSYIGLILLGIPFAVPLAIFAGLLEIIPYVGPIIAAVPATLIGFGLSPVMGLAAASLAFLIQQLENYIFVPKVMQKATGVSPIVTLLALAVGFSLAGIVGVIISVPVVITLQILIKEHFKLT